MNFDNNTSPKVNDKSMAREPKKKQWLWTILFIAIALVSIVAVVAQSRDFSFSEFVSAIKNSSWGWLVAGFCCMLGFIVFEALALLTLLRSFGHKQKFTSGLVYAASDIYFSAITPSATGGQPVSAFFMHKDSIPSMMITVSLVANLYVYVLAIIAIGLVCLILFFDVFLTFGLVSQILIVLGIFMQLGVGVFLFMLLRRDNFLHRICMFFLRLLCKLRILRNEDEKRQKLEWLMDNYRKFSRVLKGRKKTLVWVFLFNVLQRSLQIAVPACTYMAMGGDISHFFEIFALQGYVVLGSNFIPIPGAMGVADYLMLDGFHQIMSGAQAVNLELLSRSLSFYICILICGIITFFGYRASKRRRNK